MKQALRQFWQERDERERKMLMVLAPVLAVTLAYLLVARPIAGFLEDASRNLVAAEREYSIVIEDVARTEAARKAAPKSPVPSAREFIALVRQSAEAANINLARTQENGDNFSLWIDTTDPSVLFRWLDKIERDHGIYVNVTTIAAVEDGTKLRVQLTLKYREQ